LTSQPFRVLKLSPILSPLEPEWQPVVGKMLTNSVEALSTKLELLAENKFKSLQTTSTTLLLLPLLLPVLLLVRSRCS
jgi:hypothetical protein